MAEKMKPSGIDWIGDIPNEWDITKVKYRTSQIGSGTTPDSGNPLYYEDGCFPWIQSGDLYNADYIRDTEKKITELAVADFNALTWYEKEFVVVAMYGASVGNIAISQISSYTNQACCVLKAKDDDLRYLFYFLSAGKENMLQMAFGGTQPNISQAIIKNLPYLDVSHNEQQAIADFLDKECAQIDSIAADLEKQIALLQQYKKSLITETVTKGLDKSVPMKDSEIEWVGKIPEHWNVTKIKYFCRMYSGENLTSADIEPDGDYPVYGGNGKRGYYSNFTNDGEHVLIGRQGALCGNVHLVSGKFWATDHAVVTYPTKEIINKYLYYLLQSMNLNQYSQSAAQPGLAVNVILALKACLPSTLKEQKTIVDFLDDKCLHVDKIILQKENQFNILQQHKKSLIYEYVTGKKRVKEVR